ncbi:MAG: DUF1343 domain-containing protein [Bacteroidales bacterium]|nr:DUF1343 domain-containing protein [Bacteroidales bacterium]
MKKRLLLLPVLVFLLTACGGKNPPTIIPGAVQMDLYLPLLDGRSVAVVANHTSMVNGRHLVDTLISRGVNVTMIFSPEHGFRGVADAGSGIIDGKDRVTGVEIVSLYGSKKKPADSDLEDIDIVICDIQDVGVRFYTYISTLQYVMESCAVNLIPLIILDRPNPNGFYVDGPVLDRAFRSFVGMQQIPVVHGMTMGEYALMLNGEGLLEEGIICKTEVIRCTGYDHSRFYSIPVGPSPNLPNQNSIYLYPSLCFFEGTPVSCGRGTESPFQLFGHPDLPDRGFSFTPKPSRGAANPKLNGQKCYGTDLTDAGRDGTVPWPSLNLDWLIEAYNDFPDKENFFTDYFDTLAGQSLLREQIESGMIFSEIKESWKPAIADFMKIRKRYLLYDDFVTEQE